MAYNTFKTNDLIYIMTILQLITHFWTRSLLHFFCSLILMILWLNVSSNIAGAAHAIINREDINLKLQIKIKSMKLL